MKGITESEFKDALKMDKDFVRDMEFIIKESNELPLLYLHRMFIKLIRHYEFLQPYFNNALDIGERNPLTKRLEFEFSVEIDSTRGDLDKQLSCPKSKYDLVIFSHVIEHLFSPLVCLENIKQVLHPNGIMILACPVKPHFLTWGKGHFHEMDSYRLEKLLKRAGFEILIWEKFRNIRTWKSFIGIRPILRQFFKAQTVIICRVAGTQYFEQILLKTVKGSSKESNPYSTSNRTKALEMEEKFMASVK